MTLVFCPDASSVRNLEKGKKVVVNLNKAGKEELRSKMPGTAQFLDSLRAEMDRLIPGSSKRLNAAMRDAVHGTVNRFHFTETGADGVTYEVGTAYAAPRAVVKTNEMVLK